MSKFKFNVNDQPVTGYQLQEFLGAGHFGEVWKAIEIKSGIYVAIKLIDLSRSPSAMKELKSLNLVRYLRHPNLVPIFAARLKDLDGREVALTDTDLIKKNKRYSTLAIVMGLGDQSLSARLKAFNSHSIESQVFGLPLEEVIGYMEGAAKGIDYLNRSSHGLPSGVADGPIIHCDIKPENLMIVSGEVQIADCGVAVLISKDVRDTLAACSLAYSAPELLHNQPSLGSDQYSLAITYFELRTGQLPFDKAIGQVSLMMLHAQGELNFDHETLSLAETRVLKWATIAQPTSRYASCREFVSQLRKAAYDEIALPPGHPDLNLPSTGSRTVATPPKRLIKQSTELRESENPYTHSSDAIHIQPDNDDERIQIVDENQSKAFHDGADHEHPQHMKSLYTQEPPSIPEMCDHSSPQSIIYEPDAYKLTTTDCQSPPPILVLNDCDDPTSEYINSNMRVHAQPIRSEESSEQRFETTNEDHLSASCADPTSIRSENPLLDETNLDSSSVLERHLSVALAEHTRGTSSDILDSPAFDQRRDFHNRANYIHTRRNISRLLFVLSGLAFVCIIAFGISRPERASLPIGDLQNSTQQAHAPELYTTTPSIVSDFRIESIKSIDPQELLSKIEPFLNQTANHDQRRQLVGYLIKLCTDDKIRQSQFANTILKSESVLEQIDDNSHWQTISVWLLDNIESTYASQLRQYLLALAQQDVPPPHRQLTQASAKEFHQVLARVLSRLKTQLTPKLLHDLVLLDDLSQAWLDSLSLKPSIQTFSKKLVVSKDDRIPMYWVGLVVDLLRHAQYPDLDITTVRKLRDVSTQLDTIPEAAKVEIEAHYQNSLASYVHERVLEPDPDYRQIIETCQDDFANGWRNLTVAEQALFGSATTPKISELLEAVDVSRAQLAIADDMRVWKKYLLAVSQHPEPQVELLAEIYESRPKFLMIPIRKQFAAKILGKHGMAFTTHDMSFEDLLSDNFNPYERNDQQLKYLNLAYQLDTEQRPNWHIRLALLAHACQNKSLAESITDHVLLDDTKVKSEDSPLALAYYRLQMQNEGLPETAKLSARVSFVRLALRMLDGSFSDCITLMQQHTVESHLLSKIVAIAKLDTNNPPISDESNVGLATIIAQVRVKILTQTLGRDLQESLLENLNLIMPKLTEQHPDYADAHALRAYISFQSFSSHIDPATRRPIGRLHLATEQHRQGSWALIQADLIKTLNAQPNHRMGNLVQAYRIATELGIFPRYTSPVSFRHTDISPNTKVIDQVSWRFEQSKMNSVPARIQSTGLHDLDFPRFGQ